MVINEEILKLLRETVPGSTAIYRLRGGRLETLYSSPDIFADLGFGKEEYEAAVSKDAMSMVVPADRPALLEAVKKCGDGGGTCDVYYRVLHRKRGFDWIHAKVSLCGELDGCKTFFLILSNSSVETDMYRSVLDRSARMIYVCDCRTYEILYANRAAREYCKESGDMWEGRLCYSYIHGRSEPCSDCFMNNNRGGVLSLERRNSARGTWEHLSGQYINWCGHDAFVQYIDDVTADKELRSQLEAVKRRYETAVEGAGLGVWEYDIPGHRITSPSHSFKKFGVPDVIGNVPESILSLFPEEEREKLIKMFRRIESGEPTVSEDFMMKWGKNIPLRCEHVIYTVVKNADGVPSVAYGIGMNVTEQYKEQEEFRRDVQELLNANPEALCTYRLNLSRNQCSQGQGTSSYFLKALKSDTADGIFFNTSKLIPDADEKKRYLGEMNRAGLIRRFESGEKETKIDYRRLDESGRSLWVRTYVTMLKSPESGDIEAVAYSLDISKEKQQEEIFRIVTGEEYDVIALLHLDTGMFEPLIVGDSLPAEYRGYFSGAGASFGFSGLCRTAAEKWVHPGDREKYAACATPEYCRKKLDSSGRYDLTFRYVFGGKTMYRKLQHYYLNREWETVLIFESDVTEDCVRQQKEAENARAEADRVRDIMDSITAGIAVLRMTDPDHLSFDYVNRQMYRLLGFCEYGNAIASDPSIHDELVLSYLKNGFVGVHPDDMERVKKIFHDNFYSDSFIVSNYRTMGGDGRYHWLEEEVRLRDVTSDYRVFYATYRDVEEEVALHSRLERQLEEEKSLRMQATAANAAKTGFLSRISHDIRTPMNIITSKTNFALEDINDEEKLRKDIEDIKTSSTFLLSLINDILDISKIDSGNMELHPERYRISEYFGTVREMFGPICKSSGINFSVCGSEDGAVVVDKVRLNQLTLNLISNAVKYTPEGGKRDFFLLRGERRRRQTGMQDSRAGYRARHEPRFPEGDVRTFYP